MKLGYDPTPLNWPVKILTINNTCQFIAQQTGRKSIGLLVTMINLLYLISFLESFQHHMSFTKINDDFLPLPR